MKARQTLTSIAAVFAAACLSADATSQRNLDLEPVASGLAAPLLAISPPGDIERLFIVEQDGLIKILRDGAILPTPFLDATSLTGANGERGLLGLAFHPDYDSNGYFFINYTNTSGNTRVDRFTVSANPDVADFSSQVNILSKNQPFSNHNGGCIAFGADGYLYIGMGDGGAAGDPSNRAQNPQNFHGKMLRLDIDNGLPYTIPADNPFVGDPGALEEIWSLGLRNPWRFSFDTLTGDCWIGDVGQNILEEIDFEPAGAGGLNYGWRLKEGNDCYNPSTNCDPGGLTDPIHEYTHGGNPFRCSITGGYVYRGERMATMQGRYFYGDYCSGQVWSLRFNGSVTDEMDHSTEFGTVPNITSFGQDGAGEVYVISGNGTVYKIVPAGMALDTSVFVEAGSPTTLAITGATPTGTAWLTYSLNGLGSTSVPALNVVLDLTAPQLLTALSVDAQGEASFTAQVPNSLIGVQVWAQATEMDHVSNVIVRTVQ